MKAMRLDNLYIDLIEEFESLKLPETLAMTAFEPTGGGGNPSVERVCALLGV